MPRPTYTTLAQRRKSQESLLRADENVKGLELPDGTKPAAPRITNKTEQVAAGRQDLRAQNTGAGLREAPDEINLRRELKRAETKGETLEEYMNRQNMGRGTLTLTGVRMTGHQNVGATEDLLVDMDIESGEGSMEYPGATGEEPEADPITTLMEYIDHPNIARELDDTDLGSIGSKVHEEFEIDVRSRSEWTERMQKALKLARQVAGPKNYPWPRASNIQYPLITVAALQFNARAYSAIVAQPDLVKAKPQGFDPDGSKQARADRVKKAMTWQCLEQMEEWPEEMDQLLMILPIVGMHIKKVYFDSTLERNVSEGVLAEDLVWNYNAKDFNKCPRHTHIVKLYPYEVQQHVAAGTFLDIDLKSSQEQSADNDPDAEHTFLEQHRLLDLDDDGYPEPYVVTVHRDTQKVVRIVARYDEKTIHVKNDAVMRIEAHRHFVKYGFLPNPDGSSHDIGFGLLLGPMNVSINRSLNMMFDAGHLQNAGGGFMGKGLRMKGGSVSVTPGRYVPVDANGASIRDNLVPHQHAGPSPVLFQLLGFLVEAANDIASIKDVLTGEQNQANVPASTTLALIEQGLKVQTTINQRVHRALSREFKLLYKLNGRYMEPVTYFTLLDSGEQQEVLLRDFDGDDLNVQTGSDPKMMTDMQEITRAQALLPFAEDPDFDGWKIKQRYLLALGVPDIEDLRADPRAKQAQQMAQMAALRAELEQKSAETQKMVAEAKAKLLTARGSALKAHSGATLDFAKAEAEDQTQQGEIQLYQSMVDKLSQVIEVMSNANINTNTGADNGGGVPGVEGQPGNAQGNGVPGGLPQPPQGSVG